MSKETWDILLKYLHSLPKEDRDELLKQADKEKGIPFEINPCRVNYWA